MTDGNQGKDQGRAEIEYVDGAAIAARILRRYPTQQREKLIAAMQTKAPELALKVQEKMYNFEEIRSLTPQGTQQLVHEVEHKDLVAAVAGASDEVKVQLFEGMSDRKREMVEEDSAVVANKLKPSQLKEAQWRMLQKLDELREKGAARTGGKTGTWA